MYGMVNKVLQSSISEEYGGDVWKRVSQRAGLDTEDFVEMMPYPDAISYSIVSAASEELDVPADQFLHWFGREWIRSTSQGSYQQYYEMATDVLGFLEKLNQLHQDLGQTMPGLNAPSFRLMRSKNGEALLEYYSERPGLQPFVLGLLAGLADHYGETMDIAVAELKEDFGRADVFLLTMSE